MMVGGMYPEIIGISEVGVGRTRSSQGKGAPGGRVGPGDKATVSVSAIFVITSVGEVTRNPVTLSLIIERSVGRKGESLSPSACITG